MPRRAPKTTARKCPLIVILNGPNLKQLGRRETHIYGPIGWPQLEKQLQASAKLLGVTVEIHHDSHEGHLIDRLHKASERADAIVLNPGGLTHVSVALRDAVAMSAVPVIELHISNLTRRERFRAHSYVSPVASGIIMGFGVLGYEMALWAAHKQMKDHRHA